jgi:hypothetical protein
MTSSELNCPHCDSKSFSWSVTQTQYGSVHYDPESDSTFTEAYSLGPITGEVTSVYCKGCGEKFAPDDLVDDD